MSFFRFGGNERRGFGDDFRDRGWFGGGGDRFDGGRFGGSGKGRDRPGRRHDKRGKRGGKDRRDKKSNGGGKGQGMKRRADSNNSASSVKKLKPGNNWHGEDRHALMHALTMETKPENFENDWVFVVRPPGRRRIVVAANNVTQSYNNVHAPDMKFETCLPSGNITKDAMFKQQDLTVLDAIYSPEKKKFYVVDMVHWRHYPYYDTEAEFRFFCLEDKWLQLEKPEETRPLNDHPLLLLHKYPCTSEKIEEVLRGFNEKVDDILFIKKNSLYSPSESPDCLKLKLDKLDSVLGIALPDGINFVPSSSKTKDEQKKDHKELKDGNSAPEKELEDIGSKDDKSEKSDDPNQEEDHEVDDEEKEQEDKEGENEDEDNSMDQADD